MRFADQLLVLYEHEQHVSAGILTMHIYVLLSTDGMTTLTTKIAEISTHIVGTAFFFAAKYSGFDRSKKRLAVLFSCCFGDVFGHATAGMHIHYTSIIPGSSRKDLSCFHTFTHSLKPDF